MSAVKERLWEESLPFPLLTLGRNAPHIIEQFRHTPGAVLLATGAAWEGFDFPGDCVSLLIIHACLSPTQTHERNGNWRSILPFTHSSVR